MLGDLNERAITLEEVGEAVDEMKSGKAPGAGWISGGMLKKGGMAALTCSGGYHLERGGMPFHDAVGTNCKKGATTKNHGSAVKYMG